MPDRLQQAITVLQTRFGSAAPRPAAPPCPVRPSGIAELDALTGIGGWPVGRLSLLAGARGSGKRTLAQQSLAAASREGPVAYIDLLGRLDPDFLTRFSARLDRLLVVRPRCLRDAMNSVRTLARAGVDFITIDLPAGRSSGLDSELPHVLHRIAEAECTLLLIHTPHPGSPRQGAREVLLETDAAIRYYASLIVSLERHAWVIGSDGDLVGVQVEATIDKNRLAPPGRRAGWLLAYPPA